MKLLKSIFETVAQALKKPLDGAANLFIKGCEADSLDSILEWFNKPSTPTRDIDPVVPFGGF